MSTDQDKMLRMVVQTLHDWWTSMGELASVLLAVLLLIAMAAVLLLLRWIWSGGLSRQSGFGYFSHSQIAEDSRRGR